MEQGGFWRAQISQVVFTRPYLHNNDNNYGAKFMGMIQKNVMSHNLKIVSFLFLLHVLYFVLSIVDIILYDRINFPSISHDPIAFYCKLHFADCCQYMKQRADDFMDGGQFDFVTVCDRGE